MYLVKQMGEVDVLSSSDSLIPSSAGGQEASCSGGKTHRTQLQMFLYVSKTLSRNLQDSAVSLKQFSLLATDFFFKF